MDNKPFFSVIIPTYNRSSKLSRALTSIEKQTFNNYEVIVSDDGSEDNTKEIVTEFSSKVPIKYLWDNNWGGPAKPRNRGVKKAEGEWICFLDADDWWYPNKLQYLYGYLNDGMDLVYHDKDVYSEKGKMIRKMKSRELTRPVFVDLMTKGNPLFTSSVCVRKDIVEKAGGFKEEKELIAIEDFDLWLTIALMTDRFYYINKTLGAYWIDEENISEYSENRVLKLTKLYERYGEYLLNNNDKIECHNMLSYSLGRIYYKLKMYDKSKMHFCRSLKTQKVSIKIKSFISLLLITAKIKSVLFLL